MKIEQIKGSENEALLSILVCTLEERKEQFLDRIVSILTKQIQGRDAEVVILTDNAEVPIGSKRNIALDAATGKYVCFVDDDDLVSEEYVSSILEKISEDNDVIVFSGIVTTNGECQKLAKQGIEFEHGEIDGVYYRLPNHLSVHKKETMLERFLDVRTGEDDEWAKRRLKEIKTQSRIDKILYHYDFRTDTKKYFTETEQIDSILDVEVERPKDPGNLEGSILVRVNNLEFQERIMSFPLFFIVTDYFGRSIWETALNPGWFSQWPWLTWTKSKIIDSAGNTIWNWQWDPLKDGCISHQIFHLWSQKNRGCFGIAIGTHDGTFGEWVGPVNDGIIRALLIEGSEKNFSLLEKNYSKKGWIKIQNNLITTDGGNVKFYEGGSGHTNSVLKSHTSITVNENMIQEVEKESQSLISLLEENPETRWLHIDVEGIDDSLILSLRGNEHLLPELIVYEHESLTYEREWLLKKFLEDSGYKIYKGQSRNSLALKTNSTNS